MAKLFAAVDTGAHDAALIAFAVLLISVGIFGARARRGERRR